MSALAQWLGMAGIAARQRFQYRFDFFMMTLGTLVFTLLVYLVWSAVYANGPDQSMPYAQLITYVLIGQAIDMARNGAPERTLVFDTADAIRDGDIATDLIRPVDFQARRFAEAAGLFAVELVWVTLPVLLLYVLVLGVAPPVSVAAGVGFALSLLIGFVVAFAVNSIVIGAAFWSTNVFGLQGAKRFVLEMLSGVLIPFELLPSWLQVVANLLPFKAMAYIPLSIYVGRVEGAAMAVALAEQIGWAVLMVLVSRVMWARGFRRLEAYGG